MNVAYNEISCADAAKMIGVDYSTVSKWCKAEKINCNDISDGTQKARYVIKEDEVQYIKRLKEKFGKNFIRKYRKDWKNGSQVLKPVVIETVEKPIVPIKSIVTNITTEATTKHNVDIDEIAIKIGYIQDIKDKLADIELERLSSTRN